jgi:hypothetical protein
VAAVGVWDDARTGWTHAGGGKGRLICLSPKTLSMVERYVHQNGAHIHAAMDKLEERYTSVEEFF